MATQVQRRRGTTTEHASFTGAEGELTVDTTKDTVVVHDGATAGGQPLAREDLDNVSSTDVTAKVAAGTTSAAGKVQLEDSTTSTSTTTAATPNSVKVAKDAADAAQTTADNALATSGGTITGPLTIGTDGSLTFEGSTTDDFETTLAITDPTADRTITLPDINGTLVTTGDTGTVTSAMIADGTIADGDISASAEIAVSKLADGAARQLLQTDAAGTGVEWTDNVDVPGTLDVTGNATFDANVTVQGDLTVNGTTTTIDTETLLVKDKNIEMGVVDTPTDTTADGGGITLKGTTDKTINWVDSTDSWTSSENIDLASGKTYKIAGTDVLSATALGSAVQISSDNIPAGTIVNDDVNAAAAIAGTKIDPDFGAQNLTVDTDTFFVDATNNRVGIGTTSPATTLEVQSATNTTIRIDNEDDSTAQLYFHNTGSTDMDISVSGANMTFNHGASERLRITASGEFEFTGAGTAGTSQAVYFNGSAPVDSLVIDGNGRLLVGTSSNRQSYLGNVNYSSAIQCESDGSSTGGLALTRFVDAAGSTIINLQKGRGDITTPAVVDNNDDTGKIIFSGFDGTRFYNTASIISEVDGTPGTDEMPGRIVFSTNPGTTSAVPQARMTILSDGNVGIGTTSPGTSLHVAGTGAMIRVADGERIDLIPGANTNDPSLIVSSTGSALTFASNGASEQMRLDTSGRLLVGTQTWTDDDGLVLAKSPSALSASMFIGRFDATITQGNGVGQITFGGTADQTIGATIAAIADAAWTHDTSHPTRLVFSTAQSASSSPDPRMTIKADGKVGIGATAPANTLEVRSAQSSNGGIRINELSDTYHDINSSDGNLYIHADSKGDNGSDNVLRFGVGSTGERARIDSSGRLLVGATTTGGNNASLQVRNDNGGSTHIQVLRSADSAAGAPVISLAKSRGTTASPTEVTADDLLGTITFNGYDGAGWVNAAYIQAYSDGTWTDGGDTTDNPGRLVFSTTANGESSPTERMRITSTGNILTGKALEDDTTVGIRFNPNGFISVVRDGSTPLILNRLTDDGTIATFRRSGTTVGTISVTTTATAYNTSSDYRLKENVVPLTGAADRLNQLQVHRFNFIADPDKTVDGFLAHEAQAVVPECVTGEKDAVDADGNPEYQGIDQSKLVPLLTAALQEAIAKIETLEQRLNDAGIA